MGIRQRHSATPKRRKTNKVKPTPAQITPCGHFPGPSMRQRGKEMGRPRWGTRLEFEKVPRICKALDKRRRLLHREARAAGTGRQRHKDPKTRQ